MGHSSRLMGHEASRLSYCHPIFPLNNFLICPAYVLPQYRSTAYLWEGYESFGASESSFDNACHSP